MLLTPQRLGKAGEPLIPSVVAWQPMTTKQISFLTLLVLFALSAGQVSAIGPGTGGGSARNPAPEPRVWAGKLEDGWLATGEVSVIGWETEARRLLFDFGGYDVWALDGMDGEDPESAKEWVHFKHFEFRAPDRLDLIFDLNRPWPMNQKGVRAEFGISLSADGAGVHYDLLKPPFGVHRGSLDIRMDRYSRIRFSLELKLWGLLELFMDLEEFRVFMETKVRVLAANLYRALD